jgi:hypothetical protein
LQSTRAPQAVLMAPRKWSRWYRSATASKQWSNSQPRAGGPYARLNSGLRIHVHNPVQLQKLQLTQSYLKASSQPSATHIWPPHCIAVWH